MTRDNSTAERDASSTKFATSSVTRRTAMGALGLGALATLGGGSAAAKHAPPHTPHIDDHYGYSGPADERLPGKLQPDHQVGLHIHEHALFDQDPTTMPFHFAPTGLKIDVGDIV
ncbi:MAG: hypothetical protein ABEH64_13685, partial [Salinirussus sp.]